MTVFTPNTTVSSLDILTEVARQIALHEGQDAAQLALFDLLIEDFARTYPRERTNQHFKIVCFALAWSELCLRDHAARTYIENHWTLGAKMGIKLFDQELQLTG